ncbi:MAG TPA: squalene synthase HpnC [Burkholderiaceae bacterium]|nr:squalene synthase HpnC [Burkholderiaceae bacterium]
MSVDHYENFPVASWLCPQALRPAVRAIYTYARTADDLADEGDAPAAQRLADLADYEADLLAAAAGHAPSPRWRAVFDPLGTIIARHALPLSPFTDLLSAFRQDVVQPRYADRAELLDYCRRSAHPVGRLMLHLYGVADGDALARSDAICGALQLANFWQDLSVDRRRGRLYVPLADAQRFGVAPGELLAGSDSARVRALVAELVGWTRELMHAGAPLVHRIPGRAGWELRLVVQGGLRILERIEQAGFDVLQQRPALGWLDAPLLAARALAMRPAARAVREEHA